MRRRLWLFSSMVMVAAAAFVYGCSDDDNTATSPSKDGGGGTDSSTPTDSGGGNNDSGGNDSGKTTLKAKATLAHTGLPDAGTPSGTVEFEDDGTSTTVKISISGSTAGDHGMHVHAVGDCTDDAGVFAANAGGHWNPTDAGHGYPDAAVHHAGDLGMVTISAGGTGTSTLSVSTIKLANGDALNPIGKAVVFHQAPDDGAGVNGDAGARAACGIIQAQ